MRIEAAGGWDALELRRPLNVSSNPSGCASRADRSAFGKRSEIFAAARALFDQAGNRNVTIRSLVRESNVTAPTIYKLIGNRDTVLETALVEAMQMCALSARNFAKEWRVNIISSFLEASLQSAARQPSYSRYLIRMLCGIDKGSRISVLFRQHYNYLFRDFVSEHPTEKPISDKEIDLIADVIYATIRLGYLDWTEGRLGFNRLRRDLHDKAIFLTRDFLRDHDRDAIHRYLSSS